MLSHYILDPKYVCVGAKWDKKWLHNENKDSFEY